MAARYWVGGTGTWSASNTTNWAATSGGAGGQSVPGPADSVTFDANSGTSFTVTIESGYNPSVISVAGGSATVTLNINDQTLTTTTFTFSNPTAVTRTIAFGTTGQITITGNGTTVFTVQTDNGLTTTGSRNVVFTYTGSVGTRNIGTSTFSGLNTSSLNYFVQGGTDTVTFGGASGIVVRNLDMTGFSGTFTTNIIRAAANVTFSPTMTMTAVASTINFSGSAGATQTFTSAGLTIPLGIMVSTTGGGTVVFADDVTMPTTQTLTLTSGTLNLNNRTVSVGRFSSNVPDARTLAFGTSSVLNLTAGNGTLWNSPTTTNFTVTGTAVVSCTFAGVDALGRTISTGVMTEANAISFNITGGTNAIIVTGTYNNLNFTGFSGTLSNGARTIFGNLTLSATMTLTSGTSVTTMAATSGTKTITTAGTIVDFPLTINGIGGTFQLVDDYTGGSTATSIINLTNGILDLNAKTVNLFGLVSSNSNIRRLIATGATLNLFGNATTVLNFSSIINFTLVDLATITFTYAGSTGTRLVNCGFFTETASFNVAFTSGSDTVNMGGNMRDLDFTGFTGTLGADAKTIFGNLTLDPGMTVAAGSAATAFSATSGTKTFTINGVTFPQAVTFSGAGGTFQLSENLNMGSAFLTLTAGTFDMTDRVVSAGIFASNNSNPRTIIFGNTGILNLAFNSGSVWTLANATNFSYTGTGRVNFTYSGSTGFRTINHGSSLGGSYNTRPPSFYITAGSDNIAISTGSYINDLIFEVSTVGMTNTVKNIFGNLTFSPGMTVTAGGSSTNFIGPATQTFDTGEILVDFPIVIGNGTSNGTVVLANTMVLGNTRATVLTSGTLDANGYDITVGLFSSSGSNIRSLDISDTTMTLNGTGVVWNTLDASNLGAVISNSTVLLNDDTTATKTVRLGTLPELDNIVIGGNTSTANTILLSNANTVINSITSTKTVAQTIGLNGSFTVNSWGIVGTATAPITLTDNGSETVANLHYGGTGTVDVSYYTISYSAATPADTWYALLSNNNIDDGNNTGWIFGGSSSNFFLVF